MKVSGSHFCSEKRFCLKVVKSDVSFVRCSRKTSFFFFEGASLVAEKTSSSFFWGVFICLCGAANVFTDHICL